MMSIPLIIQIGVGLFAFNYIVKSTQPQPQQDSSVQQRGGDASQGAQGIQGQQGPRGFQGAQGIQGQRGRDGLQQLNQTCIGNKKNIDDLMRKANEHKEAGEKLLALATQRDIAEILSGDTRKRLSILEEAMSISPSPSGVTPKKKQPKNGISGLRSSIRRNHHQIQGRS